MSAVAHLSSEGHRVCCSARVYRSGRAHRKVRDRGERHGCLASERDVRLLFCLVKLGNNYV